VEVKWEAAGDDNIEIPKTSEKQLLAKHVLITRTRSNQLARSRNIELEKIPVNHVSVWTSQMVHAKAPDPNMMRSHQNRRYAGTCCQKPVGCSTFKTEKPPQATHGARTLKPPLCKSSGKMLL
jgi:hypothetical protein